MSHSMSIPTIPTTMDRDAAQARMQLTLDNLLTYARLLQDALVRYGEHHHSCAIWCDLASALCTCGFDEAMDGLIPRERWEGR
jgi:hypothetical protein